MGFWESMDVGKVWLLSIKREKKLCACPKRG
jgi:hypothetical protein